MNVAELERELARRRAPGSAPASGAPRLSIEEALAYRDAGNLPDEHGRTLRLVLVAEAGAGELEAKRLAFEPDYLDRPTWRREGSAPINIVPLRTAAPRERSTDAWFDEPALAALEAEWERTGALDGMRVPAEWRGFVFKTVLTLRAARREVTIDAVVGSIARWVEPEDARVLRAALIEANAPPR
jgi:hypothetical protein